MKHPTRSTRVLRVGDLKLTLESNGQIRFRDREGIERLVYQGEALFDRLSMAIPRATSQARINNLDRDHHSLLSGTLEQHHRIQELERQVQQQQQLITELQAQMKETKP